MRWSREKQKRRKFLFFLRLPSPPLACISLMGWSLSRVCLPGSSDGQRSCDGHEKTRRVFVLASPKPGLHRSGAAAPRAARLLLHTQSNKGARAIRTPARQSTTTRLSLFPVPLHTQDAFAAPPFRQACFPGRLGILEPGRRRSSSRVRAPKFFLLPPNKPRNGPAPSWPDRRAVIVSVYLFRIVGGADASGSPEQGPGAGARD